MTKIHLFQFREYDELLFLLSHQKRDVKAAVFGIRSGATGFSVEICPQDFLYRAILWCSHCGQHCTHSHTHTATIAFWPHTKAWWQTKFNKSPVVTLKLVCCSQTMIGMKMISSPTSLQRCYPIEVNHHSWGCDDGVGLKNKISPLLANRMYQKRLINGSESIEISSEWHCCIVAQIRPFPCCPA